jgi:hypothetical protein
VRVEEVLDLAGGITYSDSILSVGVDDGDPAVLHYEPQGSAVDQVPTSHYYVDETFAEYSIDWWDDDNFLSIVLDRVEDHYGLTDFAINFTDDFEAFLRSVDLDDETDGNQSYTNPQGDPIVRLADTLWFGPGVTWPKELANHPYIHFWHRLDTALLAQGIPGMGYEVLGDAEWRALFDPGVLAENPSITMQIWTDPVGGFRMLEVDQVGTVRPEESLGDIGAIELPGSGSRVIPRAYVPSPTTEAPRSGNRTRRDREGVRRDSP